MIYFGKFNASDWWTNIHLKILYLKLSTQSVRSNWLSASPLLNNVEQVKIHPYRELSCRESTLAAVLGLESGGSILSSVFFSLGVWISDLAATVSAGRAAISSLGEDGLSSSRTRLGSKGVGVVVDPLKTIAPFMAGQQQQWKHLTDLK